MSTCLSPCLLEASGVALVPLHPRDGFLHVRVLCEAAFIFAEDVYNCFSEWFFVPILRSLLWFITPQQSPLGPAKINLRALSSTAGLNLLTEFATRASKSRCCLSTGNTTNIFEERCKVYGPRASTIHRKMSRTGYACLWIHTAGYHTPIAVHDRNRGLGHRSATQHFIGSCIISVV